MVEGGFKHLLRSRWLGIQLRGCCSFILAEKLKALKSFLKIWNKEVFGNVSSRKDFALNQVMFWDSMEGTRPSSIEKQIARQLVREEYKKWVLLE